MADVDKKAKLCVRERDGTDVDSDVFFQFSPISVCSSQNFQNPTTPEKVRERKDRERKRGVKIS